MRTIEPVASDVDEPGHRAGQQLHVRTVWISDVHLGTPGCRAVALLDFLRTVRCRTLYLVGDIVDGWQLRRSWYWPQAHNDVVQKLLRKARKGTRVVFVPGNHDEFARRYLGHNFGGIDVVEDCMHVTADGRRLWVTHGDHFDGVIQVAKWLAHLGDWLYSVILVLNRWFMRIESGRSTPATISLKRLVDVSSATPTGRLAPMVALRSRFSRSTIGRGVPAGAKMPNQPKTSMPLPASIT